MAFAPKRPGPCARALLITLAAAALCLPGVALGNDGYPRDYPESAIGSRAQYEVSHASYETYEVRPGILGAATRSRRTPWPDLLPFEGRPALEPVQLSRMPDAHTGIPFYSTRRCEVCHAGSENNLHSQRAGITCRQCHGPEPIAGMNHYYSPMNPLRRHAYVCGRCHPGANASFATFLVHEPPPGSAKARETFPVIWWAYWLMLGLLTVTLAFFIPHSLLTGVRELVERLKKDKP